MTNAATAKTRSSARVVLDGKIAKAKDAGIAMKNALAEAPAPCLIFGQRGQPGRMRPVRVEVKDFSLAGERLRFTGQMDVTGGTELGPGQMINVVALAATPEGPVIGLCDLQAFMWASGNVFSFVAGHFVFEGVVA